jgi:sec-independent protein translocase protein TatC
MTVVEHLDELRHRLIICLVAVGLASVVGFVFYRRIFQWLLGPYKEAIEAIPEQVRITDALVAPGPTDAFLTFIKIGLFSGLLIALPIVLYQLWRFITPGLTRRERRMGIPFVLVSMILFGAGTLFAFMVAPRGLAFLFSFGGTELVPLLSVDRYLSFLIFLILSFGISFEMPLVLIFMAGARVITTVQMRRWRRYAYLGTAVFAAVATPTQDPYTMLLMWIPLVLLYEGAILVARLLKR